MFGPEYERALARELCISRPGQLATGIPPQTPMPADVKMTAYDSLCLQYFYVIYLERFLRGRSTVNIENTNFSLRKLSYPHSSILFRTASLVLGSYLMTQRTTIETLEYIASYYRHCEQAIYSGALVELLYSSYIFGLYWMISGHPMDSIAAHCLQLCRLASALSETQPSEDLWIMWYDLVQYAYSPYRSHFYAVSEFAMKPICTACRYYDSPIMFNNSGITQETVTQMFPLMHKILEASSSIPTRFEQWNNLMPWQLYRTHRLSLRIYLDEFLFQIHTSPEATLYEVSREIRSKVNEYSRRLIELFMINPYVVDILNQVYSINVDYQFNRPGSKHSSRFLGFPDLSLDHCHSLAWFDTNAPLLCCSMTLFNLLFLRPTELAVTVSKAVIESAIAICRVCAAFWGRRSLNKYLVSRSLLVAGMVLREKDFEDGQFLTLSLTSS